MLAEIIDWHLKGTRYGIALDPQDGLLKAGEPGVQITWMDAKIGDWVVTPRIGKPVEINALWFNALVAMADFAGLLKCRDASYRQLAQRAREGFARFVNPAQGGLYDVLDGPEGDDATLRPNQIFAVSLPHSPLDAAAQADVVTLVGRELLTSYGLRSLGPAHRDYRPRYEGGVWERDGAYHQGPVWAWLLGHYALAHFRVHGDADAALALHRPAASPPARCRAGYGVGNLRRRATAHPARRAVPGVVGRLHAGNLVATRACADGRRARTPGSGLVKRDTAAPIHSMQLAPSAPQPGSIDMKKVLNAERQRLEAQREGTENWRLWGPYLAERAWGTVREDYSPHGNAWEYFDHDQARSRAYRWNEDGIGGICDEQQRLCFALALWNGRDPILKERMFGLTGNQGNHGEDAKEYWFYLDATPSHAWMRYLYKYPQAEYPYSRLVEENARRSRQDPPFSLLDSGVFEQEGYWDVEVRYAKTSPTETHVRVLVTNRGTQTATLHLLPTLWFRNTWSWGDGTPKPGLHEANASADGKWAVCADHPTLGSYYLYGRHPAQPLYTENESNAERLWGAANASPYVKDAFHRYVIEGDEAAVNPAREGTKFAALHVLTIDPGQTATIGMTLSAEPLTTAFDRREVIFAKRESEADGLLRRVAARSQRAGSQHPPTITRRHDLEQAVLPLRREPLARRRRPAAARHAAQRSQPQLATPQGGARDLDARYLGVSVVRGMGSGLPLRRAGAGQRGLRQGSDRTAAARVLPTSERPDSGL